MRSSRATEASVQPTGPDNSRELSAAWRGLNQTKAALRHIENRLEAAPGSGVQLDVVMDTKRSSAGTTRKVSRREGRRADDPSHVGGASKARGRSRRSPEKSSRSPLRNATQDGNVTRTTGVEFREPLASYREAPSPFTPPSPSTPAPPPPPSPPPPRPPSDPVSQLLYQSDTRDRQTAPDLDSTRSSALDATEVRYLNDRPALDALITMETTPPPQPPPGPSSSSPGSASSQRLENLRRRRPDDKLEKLKERIRRQREQLEGAAAAERERVPGHAERPVGGAGGGAAEAAAHSSTSSAAVAKTRKVAAAPPAPMYRGFNSSQTMIRMPDGKVWKEEEFHNLSREIYRDLSRQLSESTRPQQQQSERSRERKPSKPVRKVHKSASVPDPDTRPVISTTSWREGQKLVKMVLGPVPRAPREPPAPPPAQGPAQTARHVRSSSDPRPESTRRPSRPSSSERPRTRGRSQAQACPAPPSAPPTATTATATALLPPDVRGILDDLQMERRAPKEDVKEAAPEEGGVASASSTRTRRRGSGSQTAPSARTPPPQHRASRSASPAKRQPPEPSEAPPRKPRHYDADTVRQYIARQQEERRRRQADERRSQRDEAETRSRRLQELYRRQREGGGGVAKGGGGGPGSAPLGSGPAPLGPSPAPGPGEREAPPVQRRLQETFTKLMMEQAQLGAELEMDTPPRGQTGVAAALQRPGYQPSGESDKENKRQERPLSASSSSDLSLSEPPLSRNDLGTSVPSWLQPERLSPSVRPPAPFAPSAAAASDRLLLSQLLGLDRDPPPTTRPPPGLSVATTTTPKLSRIEALKATAASLSTRIESEARKLAGVGVNYGTATSVTDTTDTAIGRPRAPPTHLTTAAEADELALRIRKLLTAGRSAYDDDDGVADGNDELPGVGDLRSHRERGGGVTAAGVGHAPKREDSGAALTNGLGGSGRRRGMENGKEEEEEEEVRLHDDSGGSISEGLLLSEGSLSEGDPSPPHLHLPPHARGGGRVPRPAERLEAPPDYCAAAAQQPRLLLLSQFRREAERCPALATPPPAPGGVARGAWEELERGSPHSVINIYARNHPQGYGKATEDRPERTSPAARSVQSAGGSGDAPAYEDDFVVSSSRSSGGSRLAGRSVNSHYEELMSRRSPYDPRAADLRPHRSAGSTPNSSPHSRGSAPNSSPHPRSPAPNSSPHSRGSAGKRDGASDRSDATLVEERRTPCSPPSETPSANAKRRGSDRSSALSLARSAYSDSTLGGANGHSPRSLALDSPSCSPSRSPPGPASPPGAAAQDGGSPLGIDSPARAPATGTTAANGRTESKNTAGLQYAPGVLHQRLSAELTYLESIEESVRQLGDVERLRGVSLAQQESVSLAQILKAQQLRHERDLYELKIKAEREALEAQLHLEESRERAARAQAEVQGNLVQSQQASLQDAATKMLSQQAEAARYTADSARHIKEMTELARSQIAGALSVPAPPLTSSLYDQQRTQQQHGFTKQLHNHTHTDSSRTEDSGSRPRPEEGLSSLDSLSRSDSLPSRRPNLSGGDSSSPLSPSRTPSSSSGLRERRKEASEGRERGRKERGVAGRGSSSVEEEEVATAMDHSLPSDSVPSLLDEKADSVSIATEYSLKFDESMTEDEMEERSFRSLLPSEAHRRGTLERKPRPQEESEEEAANRERTPGGQDSSRQEGAAAVAAGSTPFSGGQHSFSRFTMDMVRQHMKEEEVRAHHQGSLLRLRQKALREKTRTELAWLEHQKKRLRDKGEDDKMPPIRKRQRGLLLKLQHEQAEIKRLQEVNKAARRERQLLLQQQEDIERMRHSTLRLRERLKCAEDSPTQSPVSETPAQVSSPPSAALTDGDGRSPSPLSVSGSETSSIMQKLKKMRSHMDEKFLTKREQHLMRRRHDAEELLDWQKRLDQEEAAVRRMEREALAAWDRHRGDGPAPPHSPQQRDDHGTAARGGLSEGDSSPVLTESSVHTEFSGSQPPTSPALSTAPPGSSPAPRSPVSYTQEFDSASPSPSKPSPPPKAGLSGAGADRTPLPSPSVCATPSQPPASSDHPPASHTAEPASDQSDIEGRIRALKAELRQRKSVVHQLKKEQKKRHKERLKAQEASLLKQLESYNDFIQKTKEELNKEPDSAPGTKPQIRAPPSASEKPRIKALPPHSRSETSRSWKVVADSEKSRPDSPLDHDDVTSSGRSRSTSVPEEFSDDDDPPTVTPTPVYGSPEHNHTLREGPPPLSPEALPSMPSSREAPPQGGAPQKQAAEPGEESAPSGRRSEVLEEVETKKGSRHESPPSEGLLKLDLEENGPASPQQNRSKPDHVSSETGGERRHSPLTGLDVADGAVQSGKSASGKSASVAMDTEASEYRPDIGSPGRNHSDIFSSTREGPAKAVKTSPSSADGYRQDFESSAESSLPREEGRHRGSEPASPPSSSSRPGTRGSGDGSRTRSPLYSSQEEEEDEEEVEDIAEELSQNSGTTNGSERMLDLQRQNLDLLEDATEKKNRSPDLSPSRTPPSPPTSDEMPDFAIGDRVLVSGVQPGTLRFKGRTGFARGFWAGVELDGSEGSNDGTYDGVAYFRCRGRHGIFAPPDRISRLPEKFGIYGDGVDEDATTEEDEDSFFDDLPDEEGGARTGRCRGDGASRRGGDAAKGQTKAETGSGTGPADRHDDPTSPKDESRSEPNSTDLKGRGGRPVPNGRTRDVILGFEDADAGLYISDLDNTDRGGKRRPKETDTLGAFADKLLDSFFKDAVTQFARIKRAKEEKIAAANRTGEGEGVASPQVQKDGLPFFVGGDQEDVSSPELCNRPESPVLGASGQEELAKRLAELELSRELLDELGGDEQDWFDEDFGLSSRREQQRQKQRLREAEEAAAGVGGGVVTATEQQVKTPPRPELPLPLPPPKLPEQPAMVVPHTAAQVERLVHAATQEIWRGCGLAGGAGGGGGHHTLGGVAVPAPSEEFLGRDAKGQDQEAVAIRSYRQAVYDLTWEILQEIYAEDPNAHQPQWVKPRRVNSSSFHRVKAPGDITQVQEFISAEVLKLYGLRKDQNQKTDWQKMLKFGRKKRDRVDHILVQELHEEEAQWVNYDEDELFVKMQLADGIFDALLRDTADALSHIQESRSRRATPS